MVKLLPTITQYVITDIISSSKYFNQPPRMCYSPGSEDEAIHFIQTCYFAIKDVPRPIIDLVDRMNEWMLIFL